MIASTTRKPTTDAYGAIAVASILPTPVSQVHLSNPAPDAADPNTAGVLPTNPRVIPYPSYGQRYFSNVAASILGGTSLVGRLWMYDTGSGKWLPTGNLLTATVVGTSGTISATIGRSKAIYFQITTVTGAVTDLSYGWIS